MPLAIDLFCGLGGWAEGLLAEGWDVVGFDIERHQYPDRKMPDGIGTKVRQSGVDFNNPNVGSSVNRSFNYANEVALREAPLTGRWIEYPAQLVVQDVLTLHGSQFRDADLIVASPPCQEYSYMAMPWTRAKAKAAAIRADTTGKMLADLNRLFDACFRIQAQASLAAGRKIPMVVENVRGAQPWVGRARWNFGSFYLWGDVPALMPFTAAAKQHLGTWSNYGKPDYVPFGFNRSAEAALKVPGFRFDGSGRSFQTASVEGVKHHGSGDASPRRKAASAMIAKIPLPLSRHIAACYRP